MLSAVRDSGPVSVKTGDVVVGSAGEAAAHGTEVDSVPELQSDPGPDSGSGQNTFH